jgi:MFS family permease
VPKASRSPGAVLAGASVAQATVSFVNFGLPAIGPELREDFGLSLFELGAVLSAGLLGSGLALVAAGIAADRVGARRTMLGGTALSSAALVVAALSTTKTPLFASLVVFGIGSAVVPVAGAGALFCAYPPERRGWALGVRQTAVPLGGTIAAVTYPGLDALGGTRLALLFTATAVAASGVGFALVVGEGEVVARRVASPFRVILRAPGMQRLLAVAACYIVVLQALLAYVVPAVRESGHSELTAAIAYFAINVVAMAARIAWGRVADRQGGSRRVRTLVEVGVVTAAGALLFAVALHGGAVAVVAAAVLFGIGALGWNALVYVSAGERAPTELAARSVAVAATVVFLLSGVATPVLGAIVDVAGWDALWVSAAALAGAGALIAARLPHVLPATPAS